MYIFGRLSLICFLCASLQAQNTGILRGTVTDANQNPLAGAVLTLSETGKKALTDSEGRYSLTGLIPGKYKMMVHHWAHSNKTIDIAVKAGVNTLDTVRLGATSETSMEIVVQGSMRESQAKALAEQRLAVNIKSIIASDQIGSFPDSNAAEATARVPGVNIARDQGEGRYVQVRGTEARLNKTTINGLALPSPEGDLRTVALDVIPLDMLSAIEVTKAITPDMDGDAVGGSINMEVRKAPGQRRTSAGIDYNYNDLSGKGLAGGDLFFGERYLSNKLGLSAGISYEESERETDNFEVEYDDGLPDDLQQRAYEVSRKRIGGHLNLDYDLNERTSFELNYNYAQFDDTEFRRRRRHRIGDERMERELKDRFESQLITSLQLKADFYTQSGAHFSISASHAYGREAEPNRRDTTFRQKNILFDPNWSEGSLDGYNVQPNPTNEDYAAYTFDDMVVENNFTSDEHNALKMSYEFPIHFGDNFAQMKFGAKFRTKDKMRDVAVTVYESSQDLSFADFIDNGWSNPDFLGGQYAMGSFHSRNQVNTLVNLLDESEIDYEEESADYDISEDQTAAYAMATIELGDKWTLLPGLRYEKISANYTGYEVLFNDDGDFAAKNPLEGSKDDDILMPMIHGTFRLADNSQIRGAFTRAYARARVYDQVPYQLILEEDLEREVGNPDLEITTSWNLDLSYERYFDSVGLFSIGVFYKDLTDYIYIFNEDRIIDGEEWEVTTPLNGGDAELSGMEVAFQKNFTGLPAPFNGLGIYANYTWTDSEAVLSDRTITLPGQTEETGNFSLIYERAGFSARLAANLHGEYIKEVGDDPSEDIWQDAHTQLDFTASYRQNSWRLFLELVNLNNEKFILYEGDANHPIQLEQYKTWGRIGLKFDF